MISENKLSFFEGSLSVNPSPLILFEGQQEDSFLSDNNSTVHSEKWDHLNNIITMPGISTEINQFGDERRDLNIFSSLTLKDDGEGHGIKK